VQAVAQATTDATPTRVILVVGGTPTQAVADAPPPEGGDTGGGVRNIAVVAVLAVVAIGVAGVIAVAVIFGLWLRRRTQ
jgi:hypothetical protein